MKRKSAALLCAAALVCSMPAVGVAAEAEDTEADQAAAHLMYGAEYDELMEAVEKCQDQFETVKVAEPLLGKVGADASEINEDKVREYTAPWPNRILLPR